LITGESNFDEKSVEEMFKKSSTDQSCIRKRNTTYKIGTLLVSFRTIRSPLFHFIFFYLLDCFNIGDYQGCKTLRENGTVPAIYLNGTCISEESKFEEIRQNIAYFYNCSKNATEEKIYVNLTTCGDLTEFPKNNEDKYDLFDIPR
jgi:hypothetical protein